MQEIYRKNAFKIFKDGDMYSFWFGNTIVLRLNVTVIKEAVQAISQFEGMN